MTSICNYPLRFEPLFRQYLWGGRRLATMLNKQLGQGDDYAESWEIVDHGEDQSVVAYGPTRGLTLHKLVANHPEELFGHHANQTQFPLLFKFLDCNRTLSVQVHPNDQQAALLDPPDLGKTEAWVVLAAEPGSKIYAGLKSGVTREDLGSAIEAGKCAECLHEFEPQTGDCVFIRAGTVHALGAGLVIAEIQQASDTTFRLFDWNRVDAQGNPRQLHIEQSLAVTDYDRGPVAPQQPASTDVPCRDRLVHCDKFILDRCTITQPTRFGGDQQFHLLVPLKGAITLAGDASEKPLSLGDTCLLPAAAGDVEACPEGEAVVLDIYLP
ncbi:type I phosphomannose isomerase catalytic subunit [Bythopirellula polymerisocia]|uniref:Putative mannose-6-phosphate isomerase GmuF n=1 Tax=Bythopirellula polymerisocia TaxID=2528003 RepID=A0A5C6CA50_9BACT|nr:type I phosphomannose isomerase catalytic subunit [Bythopirellula polymerisocia]TWU20817.1 putative mannose-6-phosphate isomerase GmuF [Bythopirellula polymerisocia]